VENANKTMLLVLIGVLIAAGLIFFVLGNRATEQVPPFNKGKEVNQETFLDLFVNTNPVYIVMDTRNVNDDLVRRNIYQCGVDFAGSNGLVGRDVFVVGMEDKGCVYATFSLTANKTTSNAECMKMINTNGTVLYITAGNDTKYYSRAAIVGVGDTYVLGSCSIGRK